MTAANYLKMLTTFNATDSKYHDLLQGMASALVAQENLINHIRNIVIILYAGKKELHDKLIDVEILQCGGTTIAEEAIKAIQECDVDNRIPAIALVLRDELDSFDKESRKFVESLHNH